MPLTPWLTFNLEVKAMATAKRKSVNDAPAQRLNVRLDTEAYRRLMVHSVYSRRAPGEILADLISSNLKDWRVQSVRGRDTDRTDASGPVMDSVPLVA